MCEGGRVKHHLRRTVEDPDNAVVIVSYQAEETLGRKIAEGTPEIEIMGSPLELNAAGANASDQTQILPVLLDFRKVGGTPRRPRELPKSAYADRDYDSEALREFLRWLGITPHGSGLGKVRGVVD